MTGPSAGGGARINNPAGGFLQSNQQEEPAQLAQQVSRLAISVISRYEIEHPGTFPSISLPDDFKRVQTKGHLITKALETPEPLKEGTRALCLLIAKTFSIEGLLQKINFHKGILEYYKIEDLTPPDYKKPKKDAKLTILNLSEMLLEKTDSEKKEIYDLGDALAGLLKPGDKAFVFGCKAQYAPKDTKSFQGYSDFPQLQALISCEESEAKEQVEKVIKDFAIENVEEAKKAEVIQKYRFERALGSDRDEYNPGKILALLGQNPKDLISKILSDEIIQKSEGRISFFRNAQKVSQKIQLRNKFMAECCGYSKNEECQAIYHHYFRDHPPFPFRDNMQLIERFGPFNEFSADEELRNKLERFEGIEDLLKNFNQISSNAYRKKLRELFPQQSPLVTEYLEKLRSQETRICGYRIDEKWEDLYEKLIDFPVGQSDGAVDKKNLVEECGVDKLIFQLRSIAHHDKNYFFGDQFLKFLECYFTLEPLRQKKTFNALSPMEIKDLLNKLVKERKGQGGSQTPGEERLAFAAKFKGLGLKAEINNDRLAIKIWTAIHCRRVQASNPSALSDWYQEFQRNPPQGKGLEEFLDEKEQDFKIKLDFVEKQTRSQDDPSQESGQDASQRSTVPEQEKMYIALQLQKKWLNFTTNQRTIIEVQQQLEDRKKQIQSKLDSKKSVDPTKTAKIEKIKSQISELAIDSFKVQEDQLDTLIEDWIRTEPTDSTGGPN